MVFLKLHPDLPRTNELNRMLESLICMPLMLLSDTKVSMTSEAECSHLGTCLRTAFKIINSKHLKGKSTWFTPICIRMPGVGVTKLILPFCYFARFSEWSEPDCIVITKLDSLNSLWPGDAISQHRSGSTFVPGMACLMAPSHYIWANVNFSSVRLNGIHLRAIS